MHHVAVYIQLPDTEMDTQVNWWMLGPFDLSQW